MSATAVKWSYAQSGLSGPQKSILTFMSWRAEEDSFLAWPSVATIANSTSFDTKTVKRAISELVSAGYLIPAGTRKTRCAMDGKYRETNQYQIPVQASFVDKSTGEREEIDVPNWGQSDPSRNELGSESPPTGVRESTNWGQSDPQYTSNKLSNRQIPPIVPQGGRFEEFWSAYPRKLNKKKAQQIWIKQKLDRIADEIIAKTKERVSRDAQWKKDGGAYIPHATTYLNGERWNDQYECLAKPTQLAQNSLAPSAERLREIAMEQALKQWR